MNATLATKWTLFGNWSEKTSARSGKPKQRRAAPVFIHDAVLPWRDETLLLTLLRDEALARLEEEQPEPSRRIE